MSNPFDPLLLKPEEVMIALRFDLPALQNDFNKYFKA